MTNEVESIIIDLLEKVFSYTQIYDVLVESCIKGVYVEDIHKVHKNLKKKRSR